MKNSIHNKTKLVNSVFEKVHKKYGNFGSDIAKAEWNKIKENNEREMI